MSSQPMHHRYESYPQELQPARTQHSTSRSRSPNEDRSISEIERVSIIGEEGEGYVPENRRNINAPPRSVHMPYNAANYVPEEPAASTRRQYGSEYKQVHPETYAVPSSHALSTEIGPMPIHLPPRKRGIRQRYSGLFDLLQGVVVFGIVGVILAIPILVTADARESHEGDTDTRQTRNLVYYVFCVLLTTWGMTGCFYLLAVILPIIFYFVAHYVNPAHKKYWRIMVMMRRPITFFFAPISGFLALLIWFWGNAQLGLNQKEASQQASQQAAAADPESDSEVVSTSDYTQTLMVATRILVYLTLWAGVYLLEKILMAYLTIHYHYRSNHVEIQRSKRMVDGLTDLYEYSTMLYRPGSSKLAIEDHIIASVHTADNGRQYLGGRAAALLESLSDNFVHAFGFVFGSDSTSHWLAPRSTYTIVTRALEHPASAAALAKRIWMCLASEGSKALTVDDIKAAYGPKRTDTAVAVFKLLDENENGDIRLDEMVPSIVELGNKRNEIYAGMANMTHVVNSLDWVILTMLALVMLALILIAEIPLLRDLTQLIGLAALGLSFVLGRTLNEVVQGAIFTILDHPYDIGDVVEVYTLSETVKGLLTVKRISLLYTVFAEVGSGKQVQYANMRSKIKRISNLSRSGKNREGVSIGVDFNTTFTDIELLKSELQSFVSAPENSRDYYPDLVLRVTSLADLNRLELRISVLHKSNWSNDALRSARSSRFHCAIVAAVRRVALKQPGGKPQGNEANPTYTVWLNDQEAANKKASLAEMAAEARRVEQIAVAEEDQRKRESEARNTIMGIKTDMSERNRAISSGVDYLDAQGRSTFVFMSGAETGLRQASSGT